MTMPLSQRCMPTSRTGAMHYVPANCLKRHSKAAYTHVVQAQPHELHHMLASSFSGLMTC